MANLVPPSLPPIPENLYNEFENLSTLIKSLKLDNFEIIDKIYKYMNNYNAFVKTFTVCKQNCGACCHIHVSLTYIEAKYITIINKKIKMNDKKINFNTYISNIESGKYDKKCPFLNNQDDCSIYNLRPFNCRTFHTLDDPKLCATNKPHFTYGNAGFNYGSDILLGLYNIIKSCNNSSENPISKDIREFFQTR